MNLIKRSGLRMKIAQVFAISALGGVLGSPTTINAEEFGGPSFQRGMWAFERTLEHIGPSSRLPNATFASRQDMLRCVDPTEAMKETFRSSNVGDCHSVKPDKIDNRYVFSLRCDFMGPVRTVIEVKGDSAYTETNEAAAGKFLKRETVIAHRVGDCGAPKVAEAPKAAEYELASANSRKIPLPPTRPSTVAPKVADYELASADSRKVTLPPTAVSTGTTTRGK